MLSLATSNGIDLSVCSVFYTYIKEETSFIFASSDTTTHIQHIQNKNSIAGNILLETKTITKIQGLQFWGTVSLLEDKPLRSHYMKDFSYALALNPKLWKIKVTSFKMTDNRLGFGKKLLWP